MDKTSSESGKPAQVRASAYEGAVEGLVAAGSPERPGLWRKRVWPLLLCLPIVAVAVLASGLLLPVPILDVIASALSGLFFWLLIISGALAAMAYGLWRARRGRFRLILTGLAVFATVVWIIVGVRSVALAVRQDVPVSLTQLALGWTLENGAPDLTLPYTSHDGQAVTLSVWRPAKDVHANAKGAPVLVMTHGGGFVGGSVQEQLLPYARWFADHGYLVIGANYTLSSPTVHAWNVAEGQIACALSWANANAARHGGDVSRLAVYGESAGGNLVINAAYKASAGVLASSCGGELPRIRAVAALYPVVGVLEAYDNRHVLGDMGRKFDEQYLGGSPTRFPERYASVQSINAVTPEAPPTLLVYGEADHLVPPGGTRTFARAARAAGVDIRVAEVPFGEHGFDLVSGSVGAQVWRRGSLDWFESHLAD